MQIAAGGGAGAGDIASVLRDLRLYQHNVQHFAHLRFFHARITQALANYCMIKVP